MRFEKLNEDKIRITLNTEDLEKKDIDLHTFMSNSIESQDLFFDMLEEAEKQIGFVTKDYLIRIEALALAGGNFILTVTRTLPDISRNSNNKKVHIKRKKENISSSQFIYSFKSFDDFCCFLEFLSKSNFSYNSISKNVLLYEYKSKYYLVFDKINPNYLYFKSLFSSITEFATFQSNSNTSVSKLSELGKLIIKNNAIKIGIDYFVK